jgi:hypothetical protein
MVHRWYKSNLIWELVARKEWWKTFRLAIDSKIIIWILQTLNKKTLVSYRTKELRKYWIHLNSMRRQGSENRKSDKTQGSNRSQESPPETEGIPIWRVQWKLSLFKECLHWLIIANKQIIWLLIILHYRAIINSKLAIHKT